MSDKKHAQALIAASVKSAPSADLPRLQKAALAQLDRIRGLESEAAFRAIVTGLAFQRIKLMVKHGHWEPWLKANVKEIGLRQCRYYMKLALVFLAKSKATKEEMLALPADGVELVDANAEVKTFIRRAQEFVGTDSLADLLERHGIKGRTPSDDEDESGGGDSASAAIGEQMLFTELAEHLHGLRQTLLTKEKLMQLEPKQLESAKREIDEIHARFTKLYEQTKGKK